MHKYNLIRSILKIFIRTYKQVYSVHKRSTLFTYIPKIIVDNAFNIHIYNITVIQIITETQSIKDIA